MEYENNQKLLSENIEASFEQWGKHKVIKEFELYAFLHTLKETADSIGAPELSDFCEDHLDILAPDNDANIPVSSLKNLKKNVRHLVNGNKKKVRRMIIPDTYTRRFEQETFILVIDDDLEFVSFVKELLEQLGAQVLIAMNGKRGIQLFYDMNPNIVMINKQLPDMTGVEVYEKIRDTANDRHVVSILLSSTRSDDVIIQAYEVGMMDFLPKPLHVKLFLPYLFNRDALQKTIEQSITTDGLTGIGNRKRLNEMLAHSVKVKKSTGNPFSVVMLDIDYFKHVNDTYGHHTGDEVLKRFCNIAEAEISESDSMYRYGGEEFVILVSGEKEDAYAMTERLHAAFNQQTFETNERMFSSTFSAGIAEYTHAVEELLIEADQALYEAKRTGRDQTVIFDPKINQVKRKLQVIIVDDDIIIRTMLVDELTHWSIPDIELSVRQFKDGISFLNADWYDPDVNFIILLDGVMPGMDGLEVLERLKRRADANNILVSMMTARTSEEDIKSALWLGADDYLMKPFQNQDVLTRIQNLASRMF